jgi:hypothetical protein
VVTKTNNPENDGNENAHNTRYTPASLMLREFVPFLLNKSLLLRKQFSETLEYSACPL